MDDKVKKNEKICKICNVRYIFKMIIFYYWTVSIAIGH